MHARRALRKSQAGFCDFADALSCTDLLPSGDTACNVADCACDLSNILRRRKESTEEDAPVSLGWVILVLVIIIAFVGALILMTGESRNYHEWDVSLPAQTGSCCWGC